MLTRVLTVFVAVSAIAMTSERLLAQSSLPTQTFNLSVNPPTCAAGSTCDNLSVQSTAGAIFRDDFNTWSLNSNGDQGITFILTLAEQSPIVWKMSVAAATVQGKPDCAFSITANGKVVVENYADTNDDFHPVQFEIDPTVLVAGQNTITVALEDFSRTQLFINAVTVSSFAQPQNFVSASGNLNVGLYSQFAVASITGAVNSQGQPVNNTNIWSRAYGVNPPQDDPRNPGQWLPSLELIPGPSFVYKPDDLFQINFENQLNKTKSPWLTEFEGPDSITSTNPDDIIQHITHELNIPHNGDNTNIHAHGLHVDPSREDVLYLIIPQDDDPDTYSKTLQQDIPNLKANGGNGEYWTWQYSYKIPADHLPGTHWYHSHMHGSTSTQVENGMAGTMVIRPKDDANTFDAGLWNADPEKTHDRVMMLQEIANYGVQQGTGISADVKNVEPGSANAPGQAPDITVNGLNQPTLQLIPGQIERWRFISAGANHRTSSYLWLGKKTDQNDSWGVPIYDDAVPTNDSSTTPQMYLVAVDGITLNAPLKITASNPAVVAAGNRCDFMIRIPDQGEYAIFKNYPVNLPMGGTNPRNQKPNKQAYFGGVSSTIGLPNLNTDPFDLGTNYTGFQFAWPSAVNPSGEPVDTATFPPTSLIPLLSATADGNLVNIQITPTDTTKPSGVGWQPMIPGGGAIDNQLLSFINTQGVTGTPSNGSIPTDLSKLNLSPYSPTGSGSKLTYIDQKGQPQQGKPPGYAAPISDAAVTTPPVSMVFEHAGIQFVYQDTAQGTNNMQQYTLNGRQFNLQDFVGNPNSESLIQTPVPPKAFTGEGGDTVVGSYNYAGLNLWTNEIAALDNTAFWTNPAYFVPLKHVTMPQGTDYYTYDYTNSSLAAPTFQQVTGLASPSQPTNQTAQEWILINNSSIFHPFHIHISPFFVTEVGQLNYDTTNGWTTRYMYNDPNGTPPTRQPYEVQVTDSAVQYVVGNWWDVMMIPPQGYVKFKTWINVPSQTGTTSVEENSNSVGTWVIHCHILRHEDRGMMMVVKTKPKGN